MENKMPQNKLKETAYENACGLSEEDIKRAIKNERKKKKLAIIIAAVCAVCLITLLLNSLGVIDIYDLFGEETVPYYTVEPIRLHQPDWETDIFTLSRWLDKDRRIGYKYGAETVWLNDGDYSGFGDSMVFLEGYFDALMHGDHEAINTMYSESWLTEHGRFEAFTMQKLYDIVVERIRQYDAKLPDGTDVIRYDYKITYKIMENDGTFRSDLYSDAELAQYFELTDDGRTIEITRVDYAYWYNG